MGSYDTNPFAYHHNFLNYLDVSLDGTSVPERALQPYFDDNYFKSTYMREYSTLFSDLEDDQGLVINRENFGMGYAIFKFDLQPQDKSNRLSSFPLLKRGNLKVTARFAKALTEPINLIVVGTFPQKFEIDAARNIIQQ